MGGTIESSPGPIVGHPFVVYFQVTALPTGKLVATQVSRPDIDPDTTQFPPDFPKTCPTAVGAVTYYPLLSGKVNVSLIEPVKKFH